MLPPRSQTALGPQTLDFAALRADTLGIDAPIATPFGERHLVYADFTASGRCLGLVERYLADVAVLYANSHTEDSLTGHAATKLLHEAEAAIKRAVNAGPSGKVIVCGSGSTGAIHKLQEILGVAIPPATLHFLQASLGADALGALRESRPVVFVGPYEHHSNEVTWRESLCEVVEVDLTPDGHLDLAHLDALLQDPRFDGRRKIGSFCAASNVTGLVSPVHDIARLLHRRGALALFDYAAGAPYLPIDMAPEGDPDVRIDAVFLSPHKFLGGPGSAGVLVFDEALYPHHLPPSVGGGGTVDYVGPQGHDFTADVEAREKAGTPGLFQTLRAALALDLKDAATHDGQRGIDAIHAREHALLCRALDRWEHDDRIEILGPSDPSERIGIVSFNLRTHGEDGQPGKYLHPKFVTVLLNDLFGIQSRAGCSCAGPYGHRLLGIDADESERYRGVIRQGLHGVKPGWCRVGFHYTMDDAEADFVIEAIAFLAERGACFLPRYAFDVNTGAWTHKDGATHLPTYGMDAVLDAEAAHSTALPEARRRAIYAAALTEARRLADEHATPACNATLDGEAGALQFFAVA
ncbi:MAG: aminotransferase class V-fold PLP-dependent enzyme [Bacteroidota bacterium]